MNVAEWLRKAPSPVEVDWEYEKNAAIREWCLKQIGLKPGDRVMITRNVVSGPSSGWAPYREALEPGATGVVRSVDFNIGPGEWGAIVVLDREWTVSDHSDKRFWHGKADDTPEGYEPPSEWDQENHPEGNKHSFWLGLDDIQRVDD